MLLAKIECKNMTVDKLAEHLTEAAEQGFKVWLYDKKVYAIFRVSSISVLKKFIEKLKRAKNLQFKFFGIEEVSS